MQFFQWVVHTWLTVSFALNTMLPDDITVKVPRRSRRIFTPAQCKRQEVYYYIFNSALASALLREGLIFYYPLDVDEMDKAARYFIGTHDFLAFSASGYSAKTTVRTITEAAVAKVSQARHIIHPKGERGGQLIEFSVAGDGFLYNMVRIMAGTLVEVGFGNLREQDIPGIIAGLDRGGQQDRACHGPVSVGGLFIRSER